MERSLEGVRVCKICYIYYMPIYEYKCEKCGKVFEEHKSIHDKPLTECKACKGPVKRVYSSIGISFKGPGFHVTDYGKKNSDAASSSTPPTASPSPSPAPPAATAKKD